MVLYSTHFTNYELNIIIDPWNKKCSLYLREDDLAMLKHDVYDEAATNGFDLSFALVFEREAKSCGRKKKFQKLGIPSIYSHLVSSVPS